MRNPQTASARNLPFRKKLSRLMDPLPGIQHADARK
jgi:hypothetical protein